MSGRHDLIPTEDLFWSVVRFADIGGTSRQSQLPARFNTDQVVDLVEQQLPVSLDTVQLMSLRIEGCVVTCAILRGDLTRRVELDPELVSLVPGSVPPCVLAAAPELGQHDPSALLPLLELLTGQFTPKKLRHLREVRRCAIAGSVALTSLILAASWIQGAKAARLDTANAEVIADQSLSLLVESQQGPHSGFDHAENRADRVTPSAIANIAFTLPSDLVAARAAKPRAAVKIDDAADTLVAFLSQWPPSSTVGVDQISVQQGAVYVQCGFESRSDAESFASQFRPPSGWTLEPPRMHAAGPRTMLSIRFIPDSEGHP